MSVEPLTELAGAKILALSTVAQSLALQTPDAWHYLTRSGARLTFAAAPDGWEDRLATWGEFVPIRASRTPSPWGMMQTRSDVARLVARDAWTMIQTQTPIVGAVSRLVPRGEIPLLYVAHGFHFHRDGGRLGNLGYSGVERALAPRADAIAVVCREDFDQGLALHLDRRAVFWHLPGAGVDLDSFSPMGRPSDPDAVLRLFFIGEMNANKDPLKVVRVAALLAARRPVHLDMIGDGPLSVRVEADLRRSPVDGQVIRRTDAVPEFMSRAHALLAPSGREGLPRVLIEALACGMPVIARSNRGSRELLAGGVGTVMDPGATDEDWAAAVLGALGQPDAGARRTRAEAYSTEVFLTSYRALVQTLLVPRPA